MATVADSERGAHPLEAGQRVYLTGGPYRDAYGRITWLQEPAHTLADVQVEGLEGVLSPIQMRTDLLDGQVPQ